MDKTGSLQSINTVSLRKRLLCPDEVILERFRRNPEYGPRVLFFSGGSALRKLSSDLANFTYNSVHLITPFDSGGSSAHLRKAFNMLAVGDFRNRVMALANKNFRGNPEIVELFSYRLSQTEKTATLLSELERMIRGEHELVKPVPGPLRRIIQTYLKDLMEQLPPAFEMQGANIGNLVLVGGYLNHQRDLDPVLYLFSKLVEVRGVVRPVSTVDLHLGVELEDGQVVLGQHAITDSEKNQKAPKVSRLFLNSTLEGHEETSIELERKIRDEIGKADLICYPYGSFYTSIMACLQPKRMGETIAANGCPKVYVPNVKGDIEQRGMSVVEEIETLIGVLGASDTSQVLDFVVLDENLDNYDRPVDVEKIEEMGLQAIKAPLYSDGQFETTHLTSLLLSLGS